MILVRGRIRVETGIYSQIKLNITKKVDLLAVIEKFLSLD